MLDLRSYGVDVHSEKKWGICVSGNIEPGLLREIIARSVAHLA